MSERSGNEKETERDILNIEEAAEFLGVSIKTFNKVLHSQNLPARKIGREWKFSRRALIEWVGKGRSRDFYREAAGPGEEPEAEDAAEGRDNGAKVETPAKARRTAGWRIEFD